MIKGVNPKIKRITQDGPRGYRGTKTIIYHPLHINKLKLIDPETDLPGKVRLGYLETGEQVRVFKKTGSIMSKPKPTMLSFEERHSSKVDGELDTLPEEAMEVTWDTCRVNWLGYLSR